MTDPIADMLVRLRNAAAKKHDRVRVPCSKAKTAIASILKEEGFIKDFERIDSNTQGDLFITLKFSDRKYSPIQGLKRLSSPGRRVYVGYRDIKPVLSGRGISVLSTPKGILTDQKAREMQVGGELLLSIW